MACDTITSKKKCMYLKGNGLLELEKIQQDDGWLDTRLSSLSEKASGIMENADRDDDHKWYPQIQRVVEMMLTRSNNGSLDYQQQQQLLLCVPYVLLHSKYSDLIYMHTHRCHIHITFQFSQSCIIWADISQVWETPPKTILTSC